MTILLLGIVLTICFQVFITVGRAVTTSDQRSQNTDQARLAVQQIDRQIRSGNVLYDPAKEGLLAPLFVAPDPVAVANGIFPGLSIRVYTQANGDQRCVQWRINNGTLQTRSWSEAWTVDGDVSGWRNVAENIINTSAASPAFSLDTASGFGDRLINVRVLTNADTARQKTVEFKASVTGRNTQYGYNPNICNTIPT